MATLFELDMKAGQPDTCRKCGQQGHFAAACNTTHGNRASSTTGTIGTPGTIPLYSEVLRTGASPPTDAPPFQGTTVVVTMSWNLTQHLDKTCHRMVVRKVEVTVRIMRMAVTPTESQDKMVLRATKMTLEVPGTQAVSKS